MIFQMNLCDLKWFTKENLSHQSWIGSVPAICAFCSPWLANGDISKDCDLSSFTHSFRRYSCIFRDMRQSVTCKSYITSTLRVVQNTIIWVFRRSNLSLCVFTQIKPVASLFLLSMLLTWLLQIPVLTKFIWYIFRWICPRFLYLYNIQSDCITRFYVSHQWFCVVFIIYKTIQIFNLNCW